MVGPFIFFDQMGPAEFLTGQGIDVRPHPHIGLATVTYLLKGRMHHRDSLGTDQWITPGEVNLMTAGHGITHSERTDGPMRAAPHAMFGLQTWLALPLAEEDSAPAFYNAPESALPVLEGEAKTVRLILGEAWGTRAPVPTRSETFYADATLAPQAAIPLPDNHEDRGVYVLAGSVVSGGVEHEAGRMLVFRPGWAGRRWRGRATSGGTLSPHQKSGSKRPKKRGAQGIGRTGAFGCHPVMMPSSPPRRNADFSRLSRLTPPRAFRNTQPTPGLTRGR
jgi:redox-sensitive bicupin YhaK (pirin superfamily)